MGRCIGNSLPLLVQLVNNGENEMKSFVWEWAGSGEVSELDAATETEAIRQAEQLLEYRGYNRNAIRGDWDADGENDNGERMVRMLFWASEADADNDAGANAIGQLTAIDA